MRNHHQQMIASLKTFAATASFNELQDRKDLLSGFLTGQDFELAQVANIGIGILDRELQARKEVDLLGS